MENNSKEDFFEIRAILPEDKIPLQVGLQMLSPESIRQRFFASKKEFTENELKFLTEVDQLITWPTLLFTISMVNFYPAA